MGGYAGDAIPFIRALATVCDRLITHPNALNAAQLSWTQPNLFYVEGFGLDRFAAGEWGLRPVIQNRVGVVLDAGIEPELALRHRQAIDATRASLGLPVVAVTTTDQPLGVTLRPTDQGSGASWGTLSQPDSLLRACDRLIREARVNAIAIVARFPDEQDAALAAYRHGNGVDAIAGAEAVISHLVVREFRCPAAHAPALAPLDPDPDVSPRAAAEELGYTFFPCVLMGLSRAPQFVQPGDRPSPSDLWANEVDAIVVPASACGGSAVLSLSQQALVVAVTENQTAMHVFPQALGIPALSVRSPLEAIGAIVAHRTGLDPHLIHTAPIAPLANHYD